MSSRNANMKNKAPPAASVVKYNKQQRRVPIASDDKNNETIPNDKSNKKKSEKESDDTNLMKRKAVPTIDSLIPKKKNSTISENNVVNESSINTTNEVIDIDDTERTFMEEAIAVTIDAEKSDVQEANSGTSKLQKNVSVIAKNTIRNPYLKENSAEIDRPKTLYSPPKVVNVTRKNEGDLTAVTPISVMSPRDSIMEIDLGINPITCNEVTTMDRKPVAIIRCAYIQTEDTQTVIFWFHEQEVGSYKCQVHLNYLINKKAHWCTKRIPFGSNDAGNPVYFSHNEKVVSGKNGRLGMRLYHYVGKHPFQTLENMKITAREIQRRVNEGCKYSQLVIDDRKFFYFNKPCYWSSLVSTKECLLKLKRETSDCFNDEINFNPYFWQKHEKIIRKYFYPGQLGVDLAHMFNAPLVELHPNIERTSELLWQVENRLNNVALSHEIDYEFLNSSNNDPMLAVNYKAFQSEDLKVTHNHASLPSNDNNYTSNNVVSTNNNSTNDPTINNNCNQSNISNQASICNDPSKAEDATEKEAPETNESLITNTDNLTNDVTNNG